jgi:hypothetical protein
VSQFELTWAGPVLARLSYRPQTWLLFLALSWRPGQWGLRRLQVLPEPPRSWARRLFDAIPVWLLGLRYADFALCAGTEAERHPLIGPQTVILRACAEDVFKLNRRAMESPAIPRPYAVFLDEAIDLPHPDYRRLHLTPPDSTTYRAELTDILATSPCPVIEAPHPCRGVPTDTMNLIAHAAFVLAHSSTAVSLAVLLGKPVRIIIPDCLKGRQEGRNALAMQAALARGDYLTRYLGTPEAIAKKVTPEQALEAYHAS